VQLFECGHILEVNAMDRLIKQENAEASAGLNKLIKLPECPRCQTPLRRNVRYSNYIKRQLKLIEQVKEEYSTSRHMHSYELERQIRKLKESVSDLSSSRILQKLKQQLEELTNIAQLGLIKQTLNLLKDLVSIEKSVAHKELEWPARLIVYEVRKLKDILSKSNIHDEAVLEAVSIEIKRVYMIESYSKIKERIEKSNLSKLVEKESITQLEKYLFKSTIDFDEQIVKSLFKELERVYSFLPAYQEIESSSRTSKLIKDINKGDWLYCTEKHVFFVKEQNINQANTSIECPECKKLNDLKARVEKTACYVPPSLRSKLKLI
jgi:phage FluMu protein Com